MLSNGRSVHIARKCELTALLAAADSDQVEVFHEFLKHLTYVVISILKYLELLIVAAELGHVGGSRELLKIGASVKVSKKHV